MINLIVSHSGKTNPLRSVMAIFLLTTSAQVTAQSVPADLLDLSIEELFSADLKETSSLSIVDSYRWTVSYSYQKSQYQDYLDGTKKLAIDDVLWSPGQEPRTDKNFPVVPTHIEQEVHALVFGFKATENLSFRLAAPYISQSTEHISIVPGYSEFTIDSQGIGDITLIGDYHFFNSQKQSWKLGAGLSLPTGSIDQQGDTPRAPGKQQLPYTMQLGSGTYDISLYLSYLNQQASFNWGADFATKVRLGKNDRDYRLGNSAGASSWLRLTTIRWIQPSIKLAYLTRGRINGEDTSLRVPGPFPYPAPVVDPRLFGGNLLNLSLGLKIPVPGRDSYFDFTYSKPIYQSLNGPQSSEDYRLAISFNLGF
jgi:hypothetical protein